MTKPTVFTFLSLFFLVTVLQAQKLNTMVYDSLAGQEVLIDRCDRTGLMSGEFGEFFKPEYEAYQVNDSIAALLAGQINKYEITIVFGSWCSDSQEQVPRFFKVLDKAGYDEKHLTVIAVNRKKQAADTNISGLNIERVPTFIVYHKGKETGRIIETPELSLEEDLWHIIAGN